MAEALSWDEVAGSDGYKALSQPEQDAAKSQYFRDVVAPKVSTADRPAAWKQFQTYQPTESTASKFGKQLVGQAEAGAHLVSSVVAGFPAYMAGGVKQLADNAMGSGLDPGVAKDFGVEQRDPQETAAAAQEAVTYQPRTAKGQEIAGKIDLPLAKYGEFTKKAGEAVADKTGSATAAGVTDALLNVLPFELLGRGVGAVKARAGETKALGELHDYFNGVGADPDKAKAAVVQNAGLLGPNQASAEIVKHPEYARTLQEEAALGTPLPDAVRMARNAALAAGEADGQWDAAAIGRKFASAEALQGVMTADADMLTNSPVYKALRAKGLSDKDAKVALGRQVLKTAEVVGKADDDRVTQAAASAKAAYPQLSGFGDTSAVAVRSVLDLAREPVRAEPGVKTEEAKTAPAEDVTLETGAPDGEGLEVGEAKPEAATVGKVQTPPSAREAQLERAMKEEPNEDARAVVESMLKEERGKIETLARAQALREAAGRTKDGEIQQRLTAQAEKMEKSVEPKAEAVSTKGIKVGEEPLPKAAEVLPVDETVDTQAHEAASSPKNEKPEASREQILAGNAELGHPTVAGMNLSIENPEGSIRKDLKNAEPEWKRKMVDAHYGYIRDFQHNGETVSPKARDKDHVDAFVKPGTPKDYAGNAYVIDQVDARDKYDEAKVMLGYASEQEARKAYASNYPKGWKGLGAITELPMGSLKNWLASGNADRPLAHEGRFDKRLNNPDTQDHLRSLASEAGWAQIGGEAVRIPEYEGDPNPPVTGRTSWVPHAPWFADVQRGAALPDNVGGAGTKKAVEKAIAGQHLGAAQRAHIELMLSHIEGERNEPVAEHPYEEDAATAASHADLPETEQNLVDTDVAAKAAEIAGEQAFDDAVRKYENDDAGFAAWAEGVVYEHGKTADSGAEAGRGREETRGAASSEARGSGEAETQPREAPRAEQLTPAERSENFQLAEQQRTEEQSQDELQREARAGQGDLLGGQTKAAQEGADVERARKAKAAPEPSGMFAKEPAPADIHDFGEKIGGARKDTATSTGQRGAAAPADETPTWRKRFDAMQNVQTGKWSIFDKRAEKPLRDGWKPYEFDSEEQAEAMMPVAAVGQKHRVQLEKAGYEIWRQVTDRKRVRVVDQAFKTREDAMKYMAEHAREILEVKTNFGEEILAKPEKAVRTGAERRSGSATAKMFGDTFGFRGVEFGNWNNQVERQEVMNHAYDGLHDMAEILGVPPRALSLNGDLALAFGARGQGLSGAKAHYERDYGVINLTKMSGAGSLAHEWFHALDHYLARREGKAAPERTEKDAAGNSVYKSLGRERDLQSHGYLSRDGQLRPEVREAYHDLITTMFRKAEQYVEDTAQAEKFVGGARRHLQDSLDDVRRGLTEAVTYRQRNNKPASADQLARFDAAADKIMNGGMLKTEYRYNKQGDTPARARGAMASRFTNDALDQISAVMKEARGVSGFQSEAKGPLDRVRVQMSMLDARMKMLEDANKGDEKTKQVPTSYAMESKKIDQGRAEDYWTTPHEMAARAFSSYIEDKADEKGETTQFLSFGSDNKFYRLFNIRPFPEGAERAAIGSAFDKFFKTLKAVETDKGVALQSRAEATKQTYERRIDELMSGAPRTRQGVKVLDRADILDLLGHGDKPLHLIESAVGKSDAAGMKHPAMTPEQWKKVPEWIEHPAAVFKSDTVEGRLTLIAPDLVDGKPVLMVLNPNAEIGGLSVHVLVNAYEKDRPGEVPVARWVKEQKLLYLDQKRSPEVAARSGLQLPRDVRQLRGYEHRVKTEADLVNYRSKAPQRRSTESGPGLSMRAVQAMSDSLTERLPGAPRVLAYPDHSALPEETRKALEAQGLDGRTEGIYHDGLIYLFTNAIHSLARAKWVALHELTHAGLAGKYGEQLHEALGHLEGNHFVARLADKISAEREREGQAIDRPVALNEAAAELNAALQSGDFSGLSRYNVKVAKAFHGGIRGAIARFVDSVKRVLTNLFGGDVEQFSDADVREFLRGVNDSQRSAGGLPDGATPAYASRAPEPKAEPEDVTSIKNAQTKIERTERGLPAAEKVAKRDFGKVWDEAKAKDAAGLNAIDDLVGELKAKPRPVSDLEDAMLLHRQITLQKEYDGVAKAIESAKESGDLPTYAENRIKSARLLDDLFDLYNINKRVGTETARGLSARRMAADHQFSLATMTSTFREAVGGRKLTEGEHDKVVQMNRKVQETQEALDQHMAKPTRAIGDSGVLDGYKTRLRNRIAELDKAINTGTPIAKPAKNGLPFDTEAIALRKQRDDLQAEYDRMFKPEMTDEQRLKLIKGNFLRSKAAYEARRAANDFEKRERRPALLDPEAMRLKAEAADAKLKFMKAAFEERQKNRPPAEKAQDTFVKWRRAFLLSSPVTLAKLTSAAVQRMVITPVEELAGAGLARIPGVSGVAARAPREGGLNVQAEAKAITAAMTKGMADAAATLKEGKSHLESVFGKQTLEDHQLVDFIGAVHGALKAPVKRAEFERSLEKRTTHAIASGIDVSDPMVQTQLMLDSFKDAQRAIFMQDNRVVQFYKRRLSALEEKNKATGQTPTASKVAATVLKTLLPIVKVPTNIVAETMMNATGLVSGSAKLGRAIYKGVENLKPEEADLIMRSLKKGSLGAAMLLVGYFNPQVVGGYYERGDKGKDHPAFGTVKIGDTEIPSFLLHNPLLETMQIGATARHVADSKLRKRDDDTQGLGAGIWAAGLGLVDEVPFVRETAETMKIFTPGERSQFFGQLAKDLAVPLGVQWVAKHFDQDKDGNTVPRDPQGIWQAIETGIPGLRKDVPVKKAYAKEHPDARAVAQASN